MKSKHFIKYILTPISVAVLLLATFYISGLTLSILWGWFIVPLTSLPLLTVPHGMALVLIYNFMSLQLDPVDKSIKKIGFVTLVFSQFAYTILKCASALATGWLLIFLL